MQIAITTNTLREGGAERQRVLLANGLAARGHDVHVWCLQEQGPLAAELASSVTLRQAPWLSRPRSADVIVIGTTNTEVAAAIRAEARTPRPRIVMAVHNPCGVGAPSPSRFVRSASKFADAVVTLSAWHRDQVRAAWGIRSCEVIANGVDRDRFAAVAAARARVRDFDFAVGFLGRLAIQHKGLDVLARALMEYGGRLAIAGSGPDGPQLERLLRDLGVRDRVMMLGYMPPDEFFLRVQTLVLPSRFEGQPMVTLEALAAGMTVVATDTGGARDLLPDWAVVAPEDPQALARALSSAGTQTFVPRRNPASVVDMISAYERLMLRLVAP